MHTCSQWTFGPIVLIDSNLILTSENDQTLQHDDFIEDAIHFINKPKPKTVSITEYHLGCAVNSRVAMESPPVKPPRREKYTKETVFSRASVLTIRCDKRIRDKWLCVGVIDKTCFVYNTVEPRANEPKQ